MTYSDDPYLQAVLNLTEDVTRAVRPVVNGQEKPMVMDAMLNVACAAVICGCSVADARRLLRLMATSLETSARTLDKASPDVLKALGLHQ
jgi:hypothetical protein